MLVKEAPDVRASVVKNILPHQNYGSGCSSSLGETKPIFVKYDFFQY